MSGTPFAKTCARGMRALAAAFALTLSAAAAAAQGAQGAASADCNRDGLVNQHDALILYHADVLGDELAANPRFRQLLLGELVQAQAGETRDAAYLRALQNARAWLANATTHWPESDLNGDGVFNADDALALYNYFGPPLSQLRNSGSEAERARLLCGIVSAAGPCNAAAYERLLARANQFPFPLARASAVPSALPGTAVTLSAEGSRAHSAMTYSWVQMGGARVALQNANGVRATFTTPSAAAITQGPLRFRLTVGDAAGFSGSAETVVALVTNHSPLAVGSIPAQLLTAGYGGAPGDAVTLNISAHFSDADGDTLTYSAESGAPQIAAANVNGASLHVRALDVGAAQISVTAADAESAAVQRFAVTVQAPPNRAPAVAAAIPAQTLTAEFAPADNVIINLANYFNDPDAGDVITYSVTNGAPQIARANLNGNTLTITAAQIGAAQITINAADGRGASARQSFGVDVLRHPNRAPQTRGNISVRNLAAGKTPADFVTINVATHFHDPDGGDTLTYSATSAAPQVVAAAAAGANVTLTAGESGAARITVAARDGAGLGAQLSFTVTVTPGAPPAGTAAIAHDNNFIGAELRATGLNCASGTLRYQWERDGGVLSGQNNATLPGTQTRRPGAYHYRANCFAGGPQSAAPAVNLLVPTPAGIGNVGPNTGRNFNSTTGVELTASGLTCAAGVLAYQWQRDGADISGATNANYTPIAAGIHRYQARCSLHGYTGGLRNSYNVTVELSAPTGTAALTRANDYIGTQLNAAGLVCTDGALQYEWRRDGATLPGQNGASLPGAQTRIPGAYHFRARCHNQGPVIAAEAVEMHVPQATGIARVGPGSGNFDTTTGTQLTAFGLLCPAGFLVYQWQRNGINLGGETNSHYTPTGIGLFRYQAFCRLHGHTGTLERNSFTAAVRPAPPAGDARVELRGTGACLPDGQGGHLVRGAANNCRLRQQGLSCAHGSIAYQWQVRGGESGGGAHSNAGGRVARGDFNPNTAGRWRYQARCIIDGVDSGVVTSPEKLVRPQAPTNSRLSDGNGANLGFVCGVAYMCANASCASGTSLYDWRWFHYSNEAADRRGRRCLNVRDVAGRSAGQLSFRVKCRQNNVESEETGSPLHYYAGLC